LTATRVGQLKGKIAYMAPEQARGEIDIDRRADVFAAGIVFWEALAHRRLFKAQNEAATLARVLQEPIPSLQQAAPHLSPAICRVVMRALERDRDRRIPTCAEFADSLERAGQASGEIGSPRDLKRYMDVVIGLEIRAQREAVRAWTTQADSMGPGPMLTPTGGATTAGLEKTGAREYTAAPRSRGKSMGIFLGLVVLGAGGVLAYQRLSPPAGPSVAPQAGSLPEPTSKPPAPEPSSPEADVLPLEKKPESDALSLSDVTEDGAEPDKADEVVAPAPRPAANRRPSTRSRPPPKKNPVDPLGANPYR
jgi:serine/threonine-protein kinase